MAINRISGNILQDDLRRGSDLAIQGNLIYFDIQNNRVGVRTSTPTDDFEVDGVLRVGNVTITDIGNIDAGGVNINNLAQPVANSDAATKLYVDNSSSNVNITISDGANTQQVMNNGTLTFLDVANETTVIVSDVDTVTIGLPADVVIANSLTVTGNVTVANLVSNHRIETQTLVASSNIVGNDITSNNAVITVSVQASGNIVGNAGVFTGNVSADTFLGNIDGDTGVFTGNVSADTFLGNIDGDTGTFTGNVSGDTFLGNIEGDTGTFTGNVSSDTFLGNIDGATGAFTGNVSGQTWLGNIEGDYANFIGNIVTNNLVSNNDVTTVTITASGNISGNNFVSNNDVTTATVTASGNISLAGTLIGNQLLGNNDLTITSQSDQNITLDPGLGLIIIDTTTGLVIPVGGTAQRPASPQTGTLRFNINTSFLEVYNGVTWDSIETEFAVTNQVITPDGVSASFVLDQSTTTQNILVSINGVSQVPINNYTVSGNVLTMTETPLSTDIIDVRFITAVPTSGIGTGTVSQGQATRLARYATTGTVVTDSGADLTWDGSSLVVTGNVAADQLNIGNTVSVPGAVVRISSTDSMIVPVGDTSQRPGTPISGMMRFNQQLEQLEFYDGTLWRSASTQFTTIVAQEFVADGSTTNFVLGQTATTDQVLVTINGLLQTPITSYSITGNVLSFTAAPEDLDVIGARIVTTTQASPGQVSTGQATRLARYATTGTVITDSGADLTWDGMELTTAGNVRITGDYLQVPVYADPAARDAAIPSPVAGMIVLSGNVFTGYDGTAWRDFYV